MEFKIKELKNTFDDQYDYRTILIIGRNNDMPITICKEILDQVSVKDGMIMTSDSYDPKSVEKLYKNKKTHYLVLHDCMDSINQSNNTIVNDCIIDTRHVNIKPLILTISRPLLLSPEIRLNFEYVFLMPESTMETRLKIFNWYGGIFQTFDQFNMVFDLIVNENTCMVIDNKRRSANIKEKVFFYKINKLH
jgi:hypothetical protein